MFIRNHFLGSRTFILAVLAIALMVVDHRLPYLNQLRSALSVAVVPVQYVVSYPVEFFRWIGSSVTEQQQVLDDNARLRARQLLLEAKLQRLISLEKENTELRALLRSTAHLHNDKMKVASILAVDSDPFVQQVVLNRGSNSDVYEGQPVLDAHGVMGQVIHTGPLTSLVLLITDSRSAIPIQDSRNDIRAIAVGLGINDDLKLIHVPETTDIKKGDVLVTSGLGMHFPVGYPVGEVVAVKHTPGERFAEIKVKPSALINRSQQVLLIWPEKSKLVAAVNKQLSASVSSEQ